MTEQFSSQHFTIQGVSWRALIKSRYDADQKEIKRYNSVGAQVKDSRIKAADANNNSSVYQGMMVSLTYIIYKRENGPTESQNKTTKTYE